MEPAAFPSDTYAVRSQLAYHGYDPDEALVTWQAGRDDDCVSMDEIEQLLDREGSSIALLLLGGVNYYSGQAFDLARIAATARRHGCCVGYDLAHAAGNLELQLHDWDVDFAVWCSYKYLNAGPGAVGGCFVHGRHGDGRELPRFAGWWGNDPATRFRMHLEGEFAPVAGAEGWQLSNPPILAMAPLRASLALFDEAGMAALRAKSLRLTGYLEGWVDHVAHADVRQLTPRDPASRGCQLSLLIERDGRRLYDHLQRSGIVVDYREPDVVRAAPVPLYNSFHDVWRFGRALESWASGSQPGAGS
jgi:kynureninase